MNTVELTNLVLRHCDPSEHSLLSAAQAHEVVTAINTSLVEYRSTGPGWKSQGEAAIVLEPACNAVVGIIQGSSITQGTAFFERQFGSTVVIDGDPVRNQVTGTNSLLFPYGGASGEHQAVVWNDTFCVRGDAIERLVSAPVYEDCGGRKRELTPIDQNDSRWHTYQTGEPLVYSEEMTGFSRDGEVQFLCRVHPAPAERTVLRVQVEYATPQYQIDAIVRPKDLPIGDQEARAILAPMVEERISACTLFNGDKGVSQKLMDASGRSAQEVRRLSNYPTRPRHYVRRRKGY